MNVASAYTVGNAPTAFMAARTSETERAGAETGSPTRFSEGQETVGALKARYPIVALSYDQDASQLVMLFRDPATGDAVAQIPSKVVVRQYREAQSEKERDERRKLELIVGGAEGGGPSIGEKLAGDTAKSNATNGASASASASASSSGSVSGATSSTIVSAAPVSTVASAAPVSTSAPGGSGGASGLNLVV